MSSSSRSPIRNVPPPPGSKAGNAYTRFIPREELQDFAAWAPDTFGGDGATAPGREPEPMAPTEADETLPYSVVKSLAFSPTC